MTTDTPKRLSDAELVAQLREQVEAWSDNAGSEFRFPDIMRQAAEAIERLSTPPSQENVERAREILLPDRCPKCKLNWQMFPPVNHDDEVLQPDGSTKFQKTNGYRCVECKVAYRVSQALTEPAQGTSAEAMREAALEIIGPEMHGESNSFTPDNGFVGLTTTWGAIRRLRALLALPLPVSADGSGK